MKQPWCAGSGTRIPTPKCKVKRRVRCPVCNRLLHPNIKRILDDGGAAWIPPHKSADEMSPSDAFKKPFRYNDDGQVILDAENNIVLEVRGWGRLIGSGHGSLSLSSDEALDFCDRFGERVAEMLNENM